MRKLIFLIAVLLALNTGAYAQSGADYTTSIPLENGKYLGAQNANGGSYPDNRLLRSDGSNNTQLNAPSGSSVKLSVAQTPVAQVDANGLTYPTAGQGDILPAASVITPATNLTPTAGATFSNRVNAIATAAPTAVYMFASATAIVGKEFSVYNQGASPLQILPTNGAINVSAALTPYACATQKECECQGYTNSQIICVAK